MQTLKESLLSNVKTKVVDNSVIIEDWIHEHYKISGRLIVDNGIADVMGGGATLLTTTGPITNGFEWGYVGGDFIIINNNSIVDLVGSPRTVKGMFNCSNCNELISLKGAPEIAEAFNCSGCSNLLSLEDSPKKLKYSFSCSQCSKLKTLEGCPENVYRFICMDCHGLKNLVGAPKKVEDDFTCSCCDNLASLKGAPKSVGGNFECAICKKLTSLKYAPQNAESYNCMFDNIVDFAGIDEEKIRI